jgi:hypothetical protein
MNVVLDDAVEVNMKTKARKTVGELYAYELSPPLLAPPLLHPSIFSFT